MYKEKEILGWASERGLTNAANLPAQTLKTVAEVGELCDSVAKGEDPTDDYGDIYVTLIIGAAQAGLTLEDCIDHAYAEISKRTGRTNENGVFIKDEPIN